MFVLQDNKRDIGSLDSGFSSLPNDFHSVSDEPATNSIEDNLPPPVSYGSSIFPISLTNKIDISASVSQLLNEDTTQKTEPEKKPFFFGADDGKR